MMRLSVLLVAALAVVVAGCGNDDTTDSDSSPTIMATTSIWADVVTNVACNGEAEIITLIPPGGDPHAFQPSLQDRGRMENAAMIVANGLGLEEGLADTLEAVEQAGTSVFHMADHIETIEFSSGIDIGHHDDHDEHDEHQHDDHDEHDEHQHDDHDGHDEHDHEDHDDHDHSGDDPHVWFDPIKVADALPHLSEALVIQAGLDADTLNACVAIYRDELIALNAEIEGILESLDHEDRLLITNHDALGYFANRYNFEVLGTVIPGGSSLGETNPAQLQDLVDLIEQTEVSAIFAESTHSSDDTEALAQQAGAKVITLDTGSLGPSGSVSDTYIGFMRTNAQKIGDGLG